MRTVQQRFREKVSPANANGCWLWTAGTCSGYGRFRIGKRTVSSHRFAWVLARGPIPQGMCVLPRCGITRCCNPAHLFLSTWADHNANRRAKAKCRSRTPDTRKHGRAKLSEAQAVEVFQSAGTHRGIGAKHGISRWTVRDIKRRVTWVHATAGLDP